jgi:hypothetical protein
MRAYELGSDHDVFQAAGFRVPMVYFHDYPDVTIHTNADQPENLDATKLGRVAYMGAGIAWTLAALPQEEAGRLLDYTRAYAEERIARSRMSGSEGRDQELRYGEAIKEGNETLASVARLWPVAVIPISRSSSQELALAKPDPIDGRVPARNPGVAGPLDVYYYDYLTDVLGADTDSGPLSKRADGVIARECFTLVDGRLTVSEIRDILSGRYAPVPLGEVSDYLNLLAKAKAITWK